MGREAYVPLQTDEEISDTEEKESEEEDEDEKGLNAAIQASMHTWIVSPVVLNRTPVMPLCLHDL